MPHKGPRLNAGESAVYTPPYSLLVYVSFYPYQIIFLNGCDGVGGLRRTELYDLVVGIAPPSTTARRYAHGLHVLTRLSIFD